MLRTNKSTFHFIKSVNWIQVAVPRQALYCVPHCILWPWWMGCQLRKTGWFQLKTLSSAPEEKEKTRQDSSAPCERLLWPHFWPATHLWFKKKKRLFRDRKYLKLNILNEFFCLNFDLNNIKDSEWVKVTQTVPQPSGQKKKGMRLRSADVLSDIMQLVSLMVYHERTPAVT